MTNGPDSCRDEADRRFWIAGVPVDVVGRKDILSMIERAVTHKKPFVLANLNLHGLYCALKFRTMGNLLRSSNTIVHIDGTPILWAAYLAGVHIPPFARNGHIDLIPEVLRLCASSGWPVVIVNSDERGASQNQGSLSALVPNLDLTALPGYFDIGDSSQGSAQQTVLSRIRAIRPAILLVGMGMPRQEQWIESIYKDLDVPVIMPVGGLADYFTGRTRIPPRWFGPIGMEWAYRLIFSPRRLAFRYLVEPFLLARFLAQHILSGARWGREMRNNLKKSPKRD